MKGENLGIGLTGFLYAFSHISITLTYSYYAFRQLRNYRIGNNLLSTRASKHLSFLIFFSRVFASYWIIQLTGLITATIVQYYVHYIDFVLVLVNALFVQVLSFNVFLFPEVLTESSVKNKYSRSSLSDSQYKSLLQKIMDLAHQGEVYIDSELTLQKFSETLSINKGYVSQVINQEFGCGFIDYINHHRIEKAKKLLVNPDYSDMKLLGIAIEVGFNNKTSFNRVFKRKTRQTPSEYRESILPLQKKLGYN